MEAFKNCVSEYITSPLLDLAYISEVIKINVESETKEEERLKRFIPVYLYLQQYDAWRYTTAKHNDQMQFLTKENEDGWYIPASGSIFF